MEEYPCTREAPKIVSRQLPVCNDANLAHRITSDTSQDTRELSPNRVSNLIPEWVNRAVSGLFGLGSFYHTATVPLV